MIGDTNFWEDRGTARIAHQRILRYEDGDDEAFVESENAWLNKDGAPLLRELRRTSVQALPDKEWILEIDMQFEAKQPLTMGQTAFGPIGVRMAKTIGGHIVGMSTALEAIAAREAGLEVLGVSLVTNLAAGITGEPLNHAEVLAAGNAAAARMGGLLSAVVPRI